MVARTPKEVGFVIFDDFVTIILSFLGKAGW
jgi:hypothetical protein